MTRSFQVISVKFSNLGDTFFHLNLSHFKVQPPDLSPDRGETCNIMVSGQEVSILDSD